VVVAQAADGDGIARVNFALNGIWMGSKTTAPYTYTFEGVPAGLHTLKATVDDKLGNTKVDEVTVEVVDRSPFVLTLFDDFNGTTLNKSVWYNYSTHNLRKNIAGEPDSYWRDLDSYLDGQGHLVLQVNKIANQNGDGDPYDFGTGVVSTHAPLAGGTRWEQKFGKFEIRARLPRKRGYWFSFWLMPVRIADPTKYGTGTDGTEIDIFESSAAWAHVNQAIHADGYDIHHKKAGYQYKDPALYDGNFHTFALEWSPTAYKFFVNGVLVNTMDGQMRDSAGTLYQMGISQVPQHIIISMEIEKVDSWVGPRPQELKDLPINQTWDEVQVDYVKVWQYKNLP
jgi:beta-glucanase (GH16 family)